MRDYFVAVVVIGIPYSYVIARVVAHAWFRSKLEYHRAILNHLSRGE